LGLRGREIDTNLLARRVVRALDELVELVELRGAPAVLRVDNGPEFMSDQLQKLRGATA
jgi:hypothetical protein